MTQIRTYPEEETDIREAQRLKVPGWQLECLKLNPDYVWWGIHEEYMAGSTPKSSGWNQPVEVETWTEFDAQWSLNNLNEVVNFYFHVNRDADDCHACGGSGHNAPTKVIADSFYDHNHNGANGWHNQITQDEVQALWDKGRLFNFNPKWSENAQADPTKNPNEGVSPPTAAQVNAAQRGMGSHDAINRWILIEARAKRLGVWGECPRCEGHGYLFNEPETHLCITLWFLHPRKGCSRGVEVGHIDFDQLPDVYAYLNAAAARNAQRFSKIPQGFNVLDQGYMPVKPKLPQGG